jgi:hypothetical protein
VKHEYHEGTEARENFEKRMAALFQVKKSELKEKPKPTPKKRKIASKDFTSTSLRTNSPLIYF